MISPGGQVKITLESVNAIISFGKPSDDGSWVPADGIEDELISNV